MSDTRFTASNGLYVENGQTYLPDGTRATADLSSVRAVLLIEYGAHNAQAERDAALGRWRSVEHPDWVVYPNTAILATEPSYRECHVIDERTGDRYHYGSRLSQLYLGEGKEAAREYFAAHPVPEPKPWEQAQPGEVWALTGAGGLEQPWRRTEDERWAACVAKLILYSQPEGIIAGRRIWPEVSA